MVKPKVLLINPDPSPYLPASQVDFGAPMAILAIGTYLSKAGIGAKIIDGRIYKGEDIFACIDDNMAETDIVGLSVMTAQIKEALRISAYIKKKYKAAKIIWGGVHPTLFPEQTLASQLVDCVVIGEGEVTAKELVEVIEGAIGKPELSKIKGIGYKIDEKTVINKRRELMPMDNIPFQAFGLLDVERYVNAYYPFIGKRRELQVQASRGCPHKCAFCINYVERNYNIWRSKKPELVLNEIREIKDRYNLSGISFRDENFFVNGKHAENIINGLLDNFDIRWFASVRADYFNERHLSGDLLKKVHDAGVAYLGLGAESGSDRILKLISKDITVDQVIFAAQEMNRYDITASYSFLTGIPGETEEEMMKTIQLMKRIKSIHHHSIFSGPQILRPYPGGDLYELCIKNGYSAPTSLEEWASSETGKFGELAMVNYPWIKNPSLSIALSTYVPAALNYDFMKNLDVKRKIYAFMASIRLRLNFWKFPYEYQLTIRLLKYLGLFNRWAVRLFSKRAL